MFKAGRSDSQSEFNKDTDLTALNLVNHLSHRALISYNYRSFQSIRKCLQNQQDLQEQIATLRTKIGVSSSDPGDAQRKSSESRYVPAREYSEHRKSSISERPADNQIKLFAADRESTVRKEESSYQDRLRERDFLRRESEKNDHLGLSKSKEDQVPGDLRTEAQNKQYTAQEKDKFSPRPIKENENQDSIQSYLPAEDTKPSSKRQTVGSYNPSPAEASMRKTANESFKRLGAESKYEKSSSNELELKHQAIQQNKEKIREDLEKY